MNKSGPTCWPILRNQGPSGHDEGRAPIQGHAIAAVRTDLVGADGEVLSTFGRAVDRNRSGASSRASLEVPTRPQAAELALNFAALALARERHPHASRHPPRREGPAPLRRSRRPACCAMGRDPSSCRRSRAKSGAGHAHGPSSPRTQPLPIRNVDGIGRTPTSPRPPRGPHGKAR
jgi:hypothetical protein